MRFEVGNPGGPGRPPGSLSGRSQALAVLDKIFSMAENKKTLEKALQTEFDKDPVIFFRLFGMPLLPKELILNNPIDTNDDSLPDLLERAFSVEELREFLTQLKEHNDERRRGEISLKQKKGTNPRQRETAKKPNHPTAKKATKK